MEKSPKSSQDVTHTEIKPEPPRTCTVIRVPKPVPDPSLTLEEIKYIAENVGRLDLKASEGIREIVKNNDNVQVDDSGDMEIELEQLPYEVSKQLYRYVKAQIRRMHQNESARRKTEERRAQKCEELSLSKISTTEKTKKVVKKKEQKPDFSGFSVQELSEYMERNPFCHEHLTEDQKTNVAMFRME